MREIPVKAIKTMLVWVFSLECDKCGGEVAIESAIRKKVSKRDDCEQVQTEKQRMIKRASRDGWGFVDKEGVLCPGCCKNSLDKNRKGCVETYERGEIRETGSIEEKGEMEQDFGSIGEQIERLGREIKKELKQAKA